MLSVAGIALMVASLPILPAVGADIITVDTSSTAQGQLPIAEGDAGFDWSGFYAGVYGGGQFSATDDAQFGLGINAGVNATFDFYLLGAEVAVEGLTGDGGDTAYGELLGRAGMVVTDDVVIYAAGGYGLDLDVPEEQDFLLGGGVEVAVSDTVSLRAQYLHSFPIDQGASGDQFTVGAQYHF